MKLTDMLIIGGLAFLVLSKQAGASTATTGTASDTGSAGTAPYMETMPSPISPSAPVSSPSTNPFISVMNGVYSFVVPKDISVPHTVAAGQYTGNKSYEQDISTSYGTIRLLPYDPRETLTEIWAAQNSAYRTAQGLAAGPAQTAALANYNQILAIDRAWSAAYEKVLG